jgi:hypothetical protein
MEVGVWAVVLFLECRLALGSLVMPLLNGQTWSLHDIAARMMLDGAVNSSEYLGPVGEFLAHCFEDRIRKRARAQTAGHCDETGLNHTTRSFWEDCCPVITKAMRRWQHSAAPCQDGG